MELQIFLDATDFTIGEILGVWHIKDPWETLFQGIFI